MVFAIGCGFAEPYRTVYRTLTTPYNTLYDIRIRTSTGTMLGTRTRSPWSHSYLCMFAIPLGCTECEVENRQQAVDARSRARQGSEGLVPYAFTASHRAL